MAHSWPDTRPVYYGTAAERAAFPAGGEAAGALFFDYDDETWYYWDGAAWQATGGALADHTHSAPGDGGNLIDLNGGADALVLSADGDDTISAPTNGQIDFEVGAADEAHLTAYGLSVQNTAFRILNASGGAATVGDVGYIDANGEYETTAIAYSEVAWCVVVIGGGAGVDIYVARRGRVTVTLNGNCAAGDYLYTSTTPTQAQPQSYTRPELFAVALTANGAGAGGTCTALMLCNTRYVNIQDPIYIYAVNPTAESEFTANIVGAPVGATLVYNVVSGNENTIVPVAADQLAKLRIYNDTRAEYLLIDSVNVGTNTITFTTAVPGTWVNNDLIIARSTTCVWIAPPPYFYDLDLSSADNTAVPVLTRAVEYTVSFADSGGAGQTFFTHPWQAVAISKLQAVYTYGAMSSILPHSVGLYQRRFCILWTASGAATVNAYLRLKGYWVAEP